ncbi:hypothetical protein HZH68_006967 [Vespula germanica]|uniref:Uncharacterized protein n=1 Tax=Vespula germanica TaxID=30212 RepID=A0A834N9H1_VESGE|nr:hypothetical protein HZH68_006967 [Vespula germanica]
MATERFSQAEPGGFEIGAIRTIGRNPKFSIEPQEDRHQFHIPNFLFQQIYGNISLVRKMVEIKEGRGSWEAREDEVPP